MTIAADMAGRSPVTVRTTGGAMTVTIGDGAATTMTIRATAMTGAEAMTIVETVGTDLVAMMTTVGTAVTDGVAKATSIVGTGATGHVVRMTVEMGRTVAGTMTAAIRARVAVASNRKSNLGNDRNLSRKRGANPSRRREASNLNSPIGVASRNNNPSLNRISSRRHSLSRTRAGASRSSRVRNRMGLPETMARATNRRTATRRPLPERKRNPVLWASKAERTASRQPGVGPMVVGDARIPEKSIGTEWIEGAEIGSAPFFGRNQLDLPAGRLTLQSLAPTF